MNYFSQRQYLTPNPSPNWRGERQMNDSNIRKMSSLHFAQIFGFKLTKNDRKSSKTLRLCVFA
jgi:hypothetical protein